MAVYIYGLRDPRNNRIRYVGKTTNLRRRFREHVQGPENRGVGRWIAALTKRGLKPEIAVIQKVAKDKWQEAERFWIAAFKEHGQRLMNGSSGGLGGSDKGHQFSPEGRTRIDAAVSKACRGKPLSEEHKRKLSEAHKGKWASAETKAKMSVAHKQAYLNDPTLRQRTACPGPLNGRYGIVMSEAQKELISKNRKGKGLGNQSAVKPYPSFRNLYTGEVTHAGTNVLALCKQRGFNRKYMNEVARGKRKQYKGWMVSQPIDKGSQ